MPVAVKVADPDPLVAVRVFDPAEVPRIQLPTVAIPLASVVVVPMVTEPPPEATANVTLSPLIGVESLEFVTLTLGGVATAAPTVAD